MATFSRRARLKAQVTFLLAIALAGYAVSTCAPRDASLGASVRHNTALHVIDPHPRYAREPLEGASGERAASAQERYRTGTVKEPPAISTGTENPGTRPRARGGEG